MACSSQNSHQPLGGAATPGPPPAVAVVLAGCIVLPFIAVTRPAENHCCETRKVEKEEEKWMIGGMGVKGRCGGKSGGMGS